MSGRISPLYNSVRLAGDERTGSLSPRIEAIERVAELGEEAANVVNDLRGRLDSHWHYIRYFGEDLPEIQNWKWSELTADKGSA